MHIALLSLLVTLPSLGCHLVDHSQSQPAVDEPEPQPQPEPSTPRIDEAKIHPQVSYTGYDGVRTFAVPVAADLSLHTDEPIAWSVGDATVATIAPAGRGGRALVTALSAGSTDIIASVDGITLTATLVVQRYDAVALDAAQARYDIGSTQPGGQACRSCHVLGDAPDHTPSELAFHDDADLLSAVTAGKYPDRCVDAAGEPCSCAATSCRVDPSPAFRIDHAWTLTAQQAAGMAGFLRSLPPHY